MTDESKSLKIVRNVAVGEGAIGLHRLLGEYQPDIVNRHLGQQMSTMNWVGSENERSRVTEQREDGRHSETGSVAERFGTPSRGAETRDEGFSKIRGHFGSRAISCSNVHGVFPVHERFWFCLVQVSTTQFCGFPLVFMARASDGTDVPASPLPVSSSNMGSPNGSLPDLTNIEQMVSSSARVTALETNATCLQWIQLSKILDCTRT